MFNRSHLGEITPRTEPVFPPRIAPSPAEVVVNQEGELYHLQIKSLPPSVITVGDPERAKALTSELLVKIDGEAEHRGLYVAHGLTADGSKLAFVTHGMGSGSSEIAFVETMLSGSLKDGELLYQLEQHQKDIIRLGTSGSLNAPVGTLVIADVVVSLNSTPLLEGYRPKDEELLEFQRALRKDLNTWAFDQWILEGGLEEDFQPVPVTAFRTSERIKDYLIEEAERHGLPYVVGATIEAPGFFAGQGRKKGYYEIGIPDLDERLAQFPIVNGIKLQNFEMEGATLASILRGHRIGVACVAVAHRPSNKFATNIPEAIALAGKVVAATQVRLHRLRYPI